MPSSPVVNVKSPGAWVITGLRRSITITVKEHDADLPEASVAVSVIKVLDGPFITVPAAGTCVSVIAVESETSSDTRASLLRVLVDG